MLGETLVTSPNEIIVNKTRQERLEWMTEDILEMTKKRQQTMPVYGKIANTEQRN